MSEFRVNQSFSVNGVSPTGDNLDLRRRQKGQISVFLALAFLALFTMFAMTINVGMVVHDKINLQNSVDFASIYVAQRQGEMLNAIAHFNYQIRQAHKLLAYRYVVLGTAGIDGGRNISNTSETQDELADKVRFPSCYSDSKLMVFAGTAADQWCQRSLYGGGLNPLRPNAVVNPTIGVNSVVAGVSRLVMQELERATARVSAINWWFTGNMMTSYRTQIAYRKAMIKGLAANLQKPIVAGAQGMKDLRGQSVHEGARKTFEYNLSESARRSGGFDITIWNSLEGVSTTQWLPQIATFMLPYYGDRDHSTRGMRATAFIDKPITYGTVGQALMADLDPSGFIEGTLGFFPEGDDYEDVLGFEKNPWYMIYNQVRGQSTSGALFSPRGTIPLVAQAFSKPFGGTIGPWYSTNWPQGSSRSQNQKTVSLWPPRRTGSAEPPGAAGASVDPLLLPNAPKYPGDRLGFQSYLAQASTGQLGGTARTTDTRFSVNDYIGISYNLLPSGTGQGLAWNIQAGSGNEMYHREMAAVAPDLFDITYYSIEPNFHENYLIGKLDTWLMNEAAPFFTSRLVYPQTIWRDLGYSTANNQTAVTIKDQLAQRPYRLNLAETSIFYSVPSTPTGIANLLTSWVNGITVNDYRAPSAIGRFGKCDRFFTAGGNRPNVPGECMSNGGRTGYSVKMVSRSYLLSSQHTMSPGSTGSILNPPRN